jgi:hypothetical protein
VSRQALLFLTYKEIEANGYETADGFVVVKGSQVSAETTPSAPPSIIQLREELAAMPSTLRLHCTTAPPDPRLVEQATFYIVIVGSVP